MAHHVENTVRLTVSAKKVWKVLSDFGGIEKFAPTIDSSPIVNGKHSGLGAKRQCVFYDGSSVVEEIVEYKEGQSITVALSEYSMPLKSATATMKVTSIDARTSDITMSMDFVVKGGPLGWIMGFFMMRPLMKGVFKKMSHGLAYHSATGKSVGNKLPSGQELSLVLNN